MSILAHYLNEFRSCRHLVPDDGELFLDALLAEIDESVIRDVLVSWEEKGIIDDELLSLASLMRKRMTRITANHDVFVDAVGTGGSRSKSFNISTAAAFVIAGAGVPVAKHGNRAATSSSGHADVVSALGIKPDVEPTLAEEIFNQHGICFLFAPKFHRLSAVLAKVRRELGRPTVFNNLGPLCNPAGAPHQLIGVWDACILPRTANVLSKLGTTKSWVVHGSEGLDEISLYEQTLVTQICGTVITRLTLTARDFTDESADERLPSNLNAADSADLITAILNNKVRQNPAELIVLINAAAAIFLTGKTDNLRRAYEMAKESLRTGAALRKMNILAAETNR